MLAKLFPKRHSHYASLPILGAIMDGFVQFHVCNGYSQISTRVHVRTAAKIDTILGQTGCQSIKEVAREKLRACGPPPGQSQDNINIAATLRILELYLDELGILPLVELDTIERKVQEYATWLQETRGLAASTVKQHSQTMLWFLKSLDGALGLKGLAVLTTINIERFILQAGERRSRASLQHVVAHLRSLLRYLAITDEVPVGLDQQIDTPRLYREEQLPKAIPWGRVRALIDSVDRTMDKGRRDYAMFQLMAHYGLRACEVVGLKLDDVDWRANRLVISLRKTGANLTLPLIEAVGKSLIDWLQNGRPDRSDLREIFVRLRGPHGVLKPTAVADALQFWSKRAGIALPSPKGTHCLRHSFAVHMLRQGVSLKTIGDILGHQSTESTCTYIRLATEDLRDVALGLPNQAEDEVDL